MSKIKKIIKSIKNKTLFQKVKTKMWSRLIKDRAILNLQLQEQAYKIIKKKYSYVLDKKISTEENETTNRIWVCWFQGIDDAPEIVKKCIQSIRDNCKDREVVILDLNNYEKYVNIPNYIKNKFEKGIISYTHFSDILRIQLLTQHGGVWIDSTVLFTNKIPEYIENNKLFVFKSINLDKQSKPKIVASSWFIKSDAHNPIIEATRNILFEYWKKETELQNYFLMHLAFKMATEKYEEEWKRVPTFNNINPHILQFELLEEFKEERFKQIKNMSTIHKLDKNIKNNDENKYTNLDYILKKL